MTSFAASLMPLVQRLRGSKRRYLSADRTAARIRQRQAHPREVRPPKLVGVNVDREVIDGWPVFTLSPHEDMVAEGIPIVTKNPYAKAIDRRAVYFHGGSFVYEIAPQHWQLAAELVRETGATILVPIYPLAPAGTASVVVPKAVDLVASQIGFVGADNVVIMGDSAGGDIALAVALRLRDQHEAAPRTVLISPVLDLGLDDPRLAELEPNDPWLALPGVRYASDLYRAALSATDPLVSPLFGDLHGLAPITLFSGTRDMLNADAVRLVALAADAGVRVDYQEAPDMIHAYPLLPIPEAKPARELMAGIVSGRKLIRPIARD